MGVKLFDIVLQNQLGVFAAGDWVQGQVVLDLDEPTKATGQSVDRLSPPPVSQSIVSRRRRRPSVSRSSLAAARQSVDRLSPPPPVSQSIVCRRRPSVSRSSLAEACQSCQKRFHRARFISL